MPMYNLDYDGKDSYFPSNQYPTIAPIPVHMEEVHSSPITEKVLSERNFVIKVEDHPSSYNIDEIFGSFTFTLHRKEINQKS